jgi:hypothetical protein
MNRQIMVYSGKHSEEYYDASTPELWAASCLELLRRLDKMGYYVVGDTPPAEPQYVDPDSLPEPYRTQAKKDNAQKRSEYSVAMSERAEVAEIKRVIEENDQTVVTYGQRSRNEHVRPIAWDLLNNRSGYEYETVRLDHLWSEDQAE